MHNNYHICDTLVIFRYKEHRLATMNANQKITDVIVKKEPLDYGLDIVVKQEAFDYGQESYSLFNDQNTWPKFLDVKPEQDDHLPITTFEPRQQSTTIHPAPQVKSCACTQDNLHQLIPAPRKYNKRTHWGIHPMERRSQAQERNRMIHVIKPM